MLEQLGRRLTSLFRATTPDPFVLAVGLTFVVFVLAFVVEGTPPIEAVRAWQGDAGFWSLLGFSMQMVLILVTGHALAATRPVRAAITRLTALPRDGAQAAALVAFVAISAALVNWGLGLIVGALLARDMGRACARRGISAHYPLLVAAGYAGLMCWHGGLSGTAPLKMTTEVDVTRFLGAEVAAGIAPLGFTDTVFSLANLITSGGLLLLVPAACFVLAPRRAGAAESFADYVDEEEEEGSGGSPASSAGAEPRSVPERIGASPLTLALVVPPLVAAIVLFFRDEGIDALDPNAINLIFLTLGLIMHGSLTAYARAVQDATKNASGIVLQFPFYAGIMGVMRTTGLAATLANGMASLAPAKLYTVTTFLSAGAVNLFVPSGGGQWAVQGPIAVQAAQDLGIPIQQVVMAVAYGDQWTNMLQPFWALPLLAITAMKARDILGYTSLFMLLGGVWMMGSLYVQALSS